MIVVDINPLQDIQNMPEKVGGVLLRVGKWHSLDSSFLTNFNTLNQLGRKVGIYYEGQATSNNEIREEANQLQDWLMELKRQNELELGVWYMATDPIIKLSNKATDTYMKLYERLGVGLATEYSWFKDNTYNVDMLKDVPIWVLDEYKTNTAREHKFSKVKMINLNHYGVSQATNIILFKIKDSSTDSTIFTPIFLI